MARDRISLTFETLGPKEEFDISMLHPHGETPMVIEVRHESGLASEVEMQTTVKPRAFMIFSVGTLFVVGFILMLYQVAAFFGPMLFPIP